MKKNIVQFRYFKDGRTTGKYILVEKADQKESLKAKNKLFKDSGIDDLKQLVPKEEKIQDGINYYTLISIENYPETLTRDNLVSGDAFKNCYPIRRLGIQTLPGTRFRINSNLDWIMVGATGLYELDLMDSSAAIVDLKFDRNSITSINDNRNAYLIIDILYEEGD